MIRDLKAKHPGFEFRVMGGSAPVSFHPGIDLTHGGVIEWEHQVGPVLGSIQFRFQKDVSDSIRFELVPRDGPVELSRKISLDVPDDSLLEEIAIQFDFRKGWAELLAATLKAKDGREIPVEVPLTPLYWELAQDVQLKYRAQWNPDVEGRRVDDYFRLHVAAGDLDELHLRIRLKIEEIEKIRTRTIGVDGDSYNEYLVAETRRGEWQRNRLELPPLEAELFQVWFLPTQAAGVLQMGEIRTAPLRQEGREMN
jgi:hypothetical protein